MARGESELADKTTGTLEMTLKHGINKSGVELWLYPNKKCTLLSKAQQAKLREIKVSQSNKLR